MFFGVFTLFLITDSRGRQLAATGSVYVSGKQLVRDGQPWVPHGFYQIAFEVAPGNLGRVDHPFWAAAYNNYSPVEYKEMRDAGADSVRIQIAQSAADPQSPLYDQEFLDKAIRAIQAARAEGLTVIVCVQDESHVPGEKPIDLPDEGTQRVWRQIAPTFGSDLGVLYELLNEPQLHANPQNWQRWKQAMTQALNVVRQAGGHNVVVADGLGAGQVLDGAPLLEDSQVAYASHPYALKEYGQTKPAWDAKFGTFSQRAPVIITEWISGGYFCNEDTPASTVRFLRYLQQHSIGLEMGIWDWAPRGFGSVRQGFPNATFSSYEGLTCNQPFFGSGKVIETWYKTGIPPQTPQ